MPDCDIVIPVYNNARSLSAVLQALAEQELVAGWRPRVIISDDGSTDNSLELARGVNWPTTWRPILILANEHGGVALARNRGIDASDAHIIFFLGADIVLRPGALSKHLQCHDQFPDEKMGALGMIRWDPRIRPTAFMEWMVHSGPQNDFDSLLGQRVADAGRFFYGSHISIKRTLLKNNKFSVNYSNYGWEDIELGHRLAKHGLQLAVLHNAVGLHHHFYTVKDIYRRQNDVGRNFHIFLKDQTIPDKKLNFSFKRVLKTLFYRGVGVRFLLYLTLRTIPVQKPVPRLYLAATSGEFWLGRLISEKIGGKVKRGNIAKQS